MTHHDARSLLRRPSPLTVLFVACLWTAAVHVHRAHAQGLEGRLTLPENASADRSPAIVYLELDEPLRNANAADAVVDQRGMQFLPRVQAIQWGGAIVLHNNDAELHNVNAQSAQVQFNVGIAPGGRYRLSGDDVRRPGVVPLLCDIHQHMRGYVVVVGSPYFTQADPLGHFRLEGLPEGPAELHVWQEFCKPLRLHVQIGPGVTHVDLNLEPKPRGAVAAQVPPLPWTAVVQRIEQTLRHAVDLAAQQQPAALEQARELCLDAYYAHFEADGLEVAIGRYISWRRKYALESRFRELRRRLSQLSKGEVPRADVDEYLSELLAELNADVQKLDEHSIHDKSSLTSHLQTGGAAMPGASSQEIHVSDADVQAVLRALHGEFAEVSALVQAGRHREAASRLGDAYFEQFHQIEPMLLAQDFTQTTRLENEFTRLRGLASQGRSREVHDGLLSLYARIEQAARPASLWSMALNALVIVLREGVEAILVVTALITFLIKTNRREHLPAVYWGVAAALALSVVTWAGLQGIIANAGFAREVIEGVVALVAAAVLFYVSYWLISKAESQRWQQYLTRRFQHGTAAGSRWALGTTAFLAVYREGAETILMFQPIASSGAQGWTVVAAALLGGGLLLAGIFWLVRLAGMRLPLRQFFQFTGSLLMLLAVIFVGKGIAELQEAGALPITPLAALPLIPQLGIFPTLQTLMAQGVLAIAALVGLWIMCWSPKAAHATPAPPSQTASPRRLEPHAEHATPGVPETKREGVKA